MMPRCGVGLGRVADVMPAYGTRYGNFCEFISCCT
jgi:hypothetical protein